MKGFYINFPLCKRFCKYCDFYKEKFDKNLSNLYIAELIKEMREYKGEEIDTIYLGGGSPSILGEELIQLFDTIYKNFTVFKNPEITIEVNPEDVDDEKIKIWKECGINRVSIGIQTFNGKILSLMRRGYDSKEAIFVTGKIRENFNNLNIDMIFGFPYQDFKILEDDLKKVLKINPEHLSFYLLSWSSPLMEEFKTFKLSEEEERDMYYFIVATLKGNGFRHYEISNFAKIGFESKHNLKYWKMEEWIGIGAGACSYLDGKWMRNSPLSLYLKGIRKIEERKIDEFDKIMMGLRLRDGIKFKREWMKNLEGKKEFFDISGNRVRIKDEYVFISNSIIGEIF